MSKKKKRKGVSKRRRNALAKLRSLDKATPPRAIVQVIYEDEEKVDEFYPIFGSDNAVETFANNALQNLDVDHCIIIAGTADTSEGGIHVKSDEFLAGVSRAEPE